MRQQRIALIGDYNPAHVAHRAIPEALRLANDTEFEWIHTSTITDAAKQLEPFDGIWCVPASPYANSEAALAAIQFAREQNRPFLGTCGGFQHALLEYARNVRGLLQAAHAEEDPNAALQLIAPLSCPLVEKGGDIILADETLLRQAYGQPRVTEEYHCSYGLNRAFESQIFDGHLKATAHDVDGDVRGIELSGHPFFVATLFQPERRALRGEAPPIVAAFVKAMKRQ